MLRPRNANNGTRYRRAANVQRASNTGLGYATESINRNAQVAYTVVPKTGAKRVQNVLNAPVTRVELIRNVKRHMHRTRRAS